MISRSVRAPHPPLFTTVCTVPPSAVLILMFCVLMCSFYLTVHRDLPLPIGPPPSYTTLSNKLQPPPPTPPRPPTLASTAHTILPLHPPTLWG